ncbi:nucleotide pyrophosphohydrolase [Patescibacteria group bacterium]|nr:nucleotide pyrophosphohydrolase [Patescibacteria group bacterium]MBU1890386.1 nucleotide pyrophosphohydrolase [Patescibacteria group bacterium]
MKNIEKKIIKHLKDRGWDNLRPSDIAKSIMIEGAELLELFQWENLPLKDIKRDKKKVNEIKKELADVLIYTIEMAVLLGIDSEKAILEKLDHVNKKYPAKLMRKDSKGDPGTGEDSDYWRIKKDYRKNGKKS